MDTVLYDDVAVRAPAHYGVVEGLLKMQPGRLGSFSPAATISSPTCCLQRFERGSEIDWPVKTPAASGSDTMPSNAFCGLRNTCTQRMRSGRATCWAFAETSSFASFKQLRVSNKLVTQSLGRPSPPHFRNTFYASSQRPASMPLPSISR